MPFDPETGLYTEGVYHTPGGGPFAGLDILNQFQSRQNFGRTRDQQLLELLVNMRKAGQAGADIAATPEGGAALSGLGTSAQSVEDVWNQSPDMRFRSQISAIAPEDLDEEDVRRIGLTTGALGPREAMSSYGREIGARAREQRATNEAVQKAMDANMKVAHNPQEAAAMTKSQMKFQLGWSEDDPRWQQMSQWIDAYSNKFGGLYQSRIEVGTARA